MIDNNVEYYNKNADAFYYGTVGVDMSNIRNKFISLLPENARILDAGCGSGRDSKAFLEAGFRVTAFDASEEMCKRASMYMNQKVLQMRFEEMTFENEFDGIWACASLLHVPMGELPSIMLRMNEALKLGGIIYASFKYGEGTMTRGERKFSDFNERSVIPLFENAGFTVLNVSISTDGREGREDEKWINVFGEK
ncbi:class I SAM-dependent methyltransferase [Butyrivibrio sp. X503]|uniref:class I SAM-dependent methyltransferase n=1 Tax=Butyrivibrio sp. X503 TaxID=2364878 RepID=UPI000EA92630|nr:class I SAM-dependent methyltransferase [Butyrivibrio sp. X503]RKM56306.1 class I SAM-dependent methyltransferase [Butyrivibrio sp. X503]